MVDQELRKPVLHSLFGMCNLSDFLNFQIQKRQSSGSMDDRPLLWAKEYVESLHQNSRATLLFGKNNVLVQPVCGRFLPLFVWSLRKTMDCPHFMVLQCKKVLSFLRVGLFLQKDGMEAIPGYLSLHQTADVMTLKWTPNQLMNGNVGELDSEKRLKHKPLPKKKTKTNTLSIQPPNLPMFSQCFLGLCYDNSFGGDCISPLSSARYHKPNSFTSPPPHPK